MVKAVVKGPVSMRAELAQDWLAWQCKMVSGILCGVIYPVKESGGLAVPLSTWPPSLSESKALPGQVQLEDAAAQVLKQKQELYLTKQAYGPQQSRSGDIVACPLRVDEDLVAVMVLLLSPRSELQLQTILKLQLWSAGWLKTLLQQQEAASRHSGEFFVTLAKAIHAHDSVQTVVMALANHLADYLGCERVSIGLRQGLNLRVLAFSHVANFEKHSPLVTRIEAAMEEAIDQQESVLVPGSLLQKSLITRAHQALAHNKNTVLSLPLPGREGFIGALTLERPQDRALDQDTLTLCQSLVAFIGPVLEIKLREERSLYMKTRESWLAWLGQMLGSSYLRLKIAVAASVLLLTVMALVPTLHEVTAVARVEGESRQILVASQSGYVKAVHVLAGDVVKAGQLMAVLDDRNLQLEQLKWQSELSKIDKEYQEALAKRDRTQVGIRGAQRDQITAELQLVDERLQQTRLTAPFDGVVLSGDLSQSLGAPVETGQVLFEVAPLNNYRVVLEVDDYNMADLQVDNNGYLIIAALPDTVFAVKVKQIIPVAVSQDSRNFFRVEANLVQVDKAPLLPGMQGVAKIEVGRRSLLWVLSHSLFDRVGLWLWSLGL